MRTFFFVMLPQLGLFLLLALVGVAVLYFGYRLVNAFLLPYMRAKKAQIEQVGDLRQWKGDAENLLAEIVNADWIKVSDDVYRIQIPKRIAEGILRVNDEYQQSLPGRKKTRELESIPSWQDESQMGGHRSPTRNWS